MLVSDGNKDDTQESKQEGPDELLQESKEKAEAEENVDGDMPMEQATNIKKKKRSRSKRNLMHI
jgi:hypothetical protein